MIAGLLAAALAAEPPTPPTTGHPFDARPRRAWDVVDLDLDLRVDPAARTLRGRAVERIEPLGLPDGRLRLHQQALRIEAVEVDGAPVPFRLGEGTLDVDVAPGVPHTIAIAWSATPETGVHFRSGKGAAALEAWTQNEDEEGRWWFPTWDHPSDTFPVAIALTVPTGLHAVANGALVGQDEVEPGWTRWRYRLEQPIAAYLVAFAVGEHTVQELPGPIPMQIVAPVGLPDALARRGLDRAQDVAAWLGALLDEPYPYPVYRQVLVQRFLYGGMENAGLTILADDLVDDDGALAVRAEDVVAHELAHQWFGDLLTCHGWRELWLNEGFATFYAARWAEREHGEAAYAADVLAWQAESEGTTAPLARRDWAATDAPPSTAEYGRGAMVLHTLRAWLGDDVFDRAIRRYVDAHRFGLVDTDDLRHAFEEVTGNDLRWWFDRLVHGWGAPAVATSWTTDGDRLEVSIAQDEEPTAWEGPVKVDWADADGVHREEVWLRPGRTVLAVDARAPRWVVVDPVGGVLARWTRTQPPDAWAAALAEAPTAYARLVAARALGDVDGADELAVPALAAALAAEPPPAPSFPTDDLARAAATALGERGSAAARDVLLAAADRPGLRPWLRADVAAALGRFPLDPAVATALERLAARVDAPRVAATALHALGDAFPSRARPAAERALAARDPSRTGALHAAALDVLGRSRSAAALDRVLPFLDDPRRDVQRAAAFAVVELARLDGVTDARRGKVALALAPWLDHEDQRLRQLGLHALARLGAPEALPAVQAFAARTTVPGDRDLARHAVAALRAAGPAKDDPDALLKAEAALKALQEKIDALSERLERLER